MTIQECLRSKCDFARPGSDCVYYATEAYIDARGKNEGNSPTPSDILANDWYLIKSISHQDVVAAGLEIGMTLNLIKKLNVKLGLE